ncbi:MAG: hypothetical protein PHX70_02610 [Clostridium sp.]|nr:hypothetical protein [Clostridium sp.]
MGKCPFLSTYNCRVECFKECAFYSDKSKEEGCPFQNKEINKQTVFLKKEHVNYYIDEEMECEDKDRFMDNNEFLQYI